MPPTTTATLVAVLLILTSQHHAASEPKKRNTKVVLPSTSGRTTSPPVCVAPSNCAPQPVSGYSLNEANNFNKNLLESDPEMKSIQSHANKLLEDKASKLGVLKKACEDMEKLFDEETVTINDLYPIYDRVASLGTSTGPMSELEKAAVTKMMRYTSQLGTRILRKDSNTFYTTPSMTVGLRGFSPNMGISGTQETELYGDTRIVNSFSVTVSEYSRRMLYRNVETVVYNMNESPLRPLPVWIAPVKWFYVVDFFLGNYPRAQGIMSLPDVSLGWNYKVPLPNVRYGCQRWNDTDKGWSTQGCFLMNVQNVLRVTKFFLAACHCNLIFNGEASEYILYQHENEVQETIHVDNSSLTDGNLISKEYTVQRSVLNDILANQSGSDKYTNLNRYLSNVTLIFGSGLSNETADAISEDVGKILLALKPDEGRHTIGYRNELLATFVVQSDLATKDDLPIGFGVYKNYSSGIECFMSTEEIDPNLLFSSQMNFSLLFSKSVVQQNSRYAFLVYPTDKYFKPTASINGEQVLNTRVVDVVLTPNHQEDIEEQFLHIYHEFPTSKNLYDCASWSSEQGNWTKEGCHRDPQLYNGVCTCNLSAILNGSETRGQFIIFLYANLYYFDFEGTDNDNPRTCERDMVVVQAVARVGVSPLYTGPGSLTLLIHQLLIIAFSSLSEESYYRLQDTARKEVVNSAKTFLLNSAECFNLFEDIYLQCTDHEKSWEKQLSFTTGGQVLGSINQLFGMFGNNFGNQDLSLQVSESVFTQNSRHVLLVYPINKFVWPPPPHGQRMYSRVVDVILKPRVTAEDVKQSVEFTLQRPANHTLGCGVWDDVVNEWATPGVCQVFVDHCNCSLTGNGGQYIVYTYIGDLIDREVFAQFNSDSVVDAAEILDTGNALIHNISQMALDSRNINDMLRVFKKMVLNVGKVVDGVERMRSTWYDIRLIFFRVCSRNTKLLQFKYQLPGSVDMVSAEISDDMFSNAVLASGGNRNVLTHSGMAFVAISMANANKQQGSRGFTFSRTDSEGIQFAGISDISKELKDNPLFAVIGSDNRLSDNIRMLFIIYPMNVSPFKYTMTTAAMFNSRQVDVYTVLELAAVTTLEIYFQPTDDPKKYIKTACAIWDETTSDWTADRCIVHLVSRYESCNCQLLSNSTVTRIIVYEYTEVPNFSLSYTLGGTSVVYLIGSTLSLIGLLIIAATAILFPDWREEVSSKILLQLAFSHFLYLVLTMFRETHTIYADMKNLDVTLVVFTVLVHYTRLVHHCWGLVMSVLQYKRFSGVVGASTTTHLLLKVGVFSWGSPLIPLAVLLSWDIREHFCIPNILTHYMLYLVPVVVITLLNIGLLVAIVRVITNGCGLWNDDELQRHGGSKRDVILRQLKQTVMMFFLFGIPAVFEMFNDLVFHSAVMVYINKALDPIQGFIMFLFFVVINDKTRGLWNVRVFKDLPPATNKPVAKKIKLKRKVRKAKRIGQQTTPVDGLVQTGSSDVKEAPPNEECEGGDQKMEDEDGSISAEALKATKEKYLKILLERYRDHERITSLLLLVRTFVRATPEERAQLLLVHDPSGKYK